MKASCWLAGRNVLGWTWLRLDTPERSQSRIQHVTGQLLSSLLALSAYPPRPSSPSQLPPHTARHRANDYTPLINSYNDILYPQHHQETDINHELLHPSRNLDARANWCVYKSICQLPLDCNLRQPASDRGKCLRSHLIHRPTNEENTSRARATRASQQIRAIANSLSATIITLREREDKETPFAQQHNQPAR